MSTIKEKHQVILLPTEKATGLFVDKNNKLYYSTISKRRHLGQGRHLYFLSDDEIKDGDWHIDTETNAISNKSLKYEAAHGNDCFYKKIIATTDDTLELPTPESIAEYPFSYTPNFLPQPPQEFIVEYVKMYNQGNPITEVFVEYLDWVADETDDGILKHQKMLKVNFDNTINIHPVVENLIVMKKIIVYCGEKYSGQCGSELHPIEQVRKAVTCIENQNHMKEYKVYSNSPDFVSAIKYIGEARGIKVEFILNGVNKGSDIEEIFLDFNRALTLVCELSGIPW